jgi:hypothetical protein
VLFFGDDHGGEAVVGRRDAYWASGRSAITDILLLSTVWVVGVVFADQNAPALGGILNQQGVSNSTIRQFTQHSTMLYVMHEMTIMM